MENVSKRLNMNSKWMSVFVFFLFVVHDLMSRLPDAPQMGNFNKRFMLALRRTVGITNGIDVAADWSIVSHWIFCCFVLLWLLLLFALVFSQNFRNIFFCFCFLSITVVVVLFTSHRHTYARTCTFTITLLFHVYFLVALQYIYVNTHVMCKLLDTFMHRLCTYFDFRYKIQGCCSFCCRCHAVHIYLKLFRQDASPFNVFKLNVYQIIFISVNYYLFDFFLFAIFPLPPQKN